MKGLIIKPKWADLILDGRKTWEIRSRQTHLRGRIGIIKSGSGRVYGTVDLVDCIPIHGEDDPDLLVANQHKHHVPLGAIPYRKPWAWVLQDPVIYEWARPYDHPQGAVIWVNIDPPLSAGEKVVMSGCYEERKHKDRIWTVISKPWYLCGTEVVLLEGYSGGFATEFLKRVKEEKR